MSNRFRDDLRIRLRGGQCVYCGENATTDEHFPPATYSPLGVIVPACRECNLFAGTAWISDFSERVTHVRNKLRVKYAALLQTPNWSYEELTDLGYALWTCVVIWSEQKNTLVRRLSWDAEAYLTTIDNEGAFAASSAEMHRLIDKEKERLSIKGSHRKCRQCGCDFDAAKRIKSKFCSDKCSQRRRIRDKATLAWHRKFG